MIWAQDRGGVLGSEGSMLWRVPADFRHFRASTLGGGLVMGRVTWDSLGGALAGRRNVVLTRDPLWQAAGAHRAASLEQAVALASGGLEAGLGADPRTGAAASWPRTWVIGGGSVYRQAMEAQVADLLVVSTIDLEAAGRAGGALVHAPAIDPARWGRDEEASDAPGTWRPRSGDARWRVDVWRRRTGD